MVIGTAVTELMIGQAKRASDVALPAVVIDIRVNARRVVVRIVIVQHSPLPQAGLLAVRERADEIAEILVRDGIGHHHPLRFHWSCGEGENISDARMRWTAVGDVDRHV